MKIYTKIVIDLKSSEVIEANWFEYQGPVGWCKGGGSTTTTTVDPTYNAGLLEISQEQQSWANELFNMFKYGVTYDPNERVETSPAGQKVNPDWTAWNEQQSRAVPEGFGRESGEPGIRPDPGPEPPKTIPDPGSPATFTTRGQQENYDPSVISEMDVMSQVLAAQASLIPAETASAQAQLGLTQAQAGAALSLVPQQTQVAQAGLGLQSQQIAAESGMLPMRTAAETASLGLSTAQSQSGMRLLPAQEEVAGLGLAQQKQILNERSPVISALYRDALSGVDVNRRVSEARAGVEHACTGAETNMTRSMNRYGLAPQSTDFGRLETEKAKSMAGTEAGVYREAEDENFKRKTAALGLGL